MYSPYPTWRVVGASVVGTSHHKGGRGCEDAHAYRQRADGSLVLVVADGAGSAPRAADGSTCAVQTAASAADFALATRPVPTNEAEWRALLAGVLAETRAALERQAAFSTPAAVPAGGGPPAGGLQDFATTLLVAVVALPWVAVLQLGDGAVVVQDGLGSFQAATVPDHGEYLNETAFVTSADYQARAQYHILSPTGLRGVALLSDGLQMLALNMTDTTPHAPFFTPLFSFVSSPTASEGTLAAFLDSERVNIRTDDDKTLLLAVRA